MQRNWTASTNGIPPDLLQLTHRITNRHERYQGYCSDLRKRSAFTMRRAERNRWLRSKNVRESDQRAGCTGAFSAAAGATGAVTGSALSNAAPHVTVQQFSMPAQLTLTP